MNGVTAAADGQRLMIMPRNVRVRPRINAQTALWWKAASKNTDALLRGVKLPAGRGAAAVTTKVFAILKSKVITAK